MTGQGLNRRAFLVSAAAAAGVLTLGFTPRSGRAGAASGSELTAWIVIRPNDRVVIRFARAEMGQGALTGLAMLVAEELECDWDKVSDEFVTPQEHARRAHVWGDMSTGGSRSISGSEGYLRKAGAIAREMLVAAAASQWGVVPTECRARAGRI